MDPLTAIGLVANLITFIDFGCKVVSASRELRESGTTAENESIEFLTVKLQGLSLDLQSGKPETSMTADELRLQGLVKVCQDISTDLLALLATLKVKSTSKRRAVGAVIQNIRKADEKQRLEARLETCRHRLHLQLSHTAKFVSPSLPTTAHILPGSAWHHGYLILRSNLILSIL
jgi:hypothetical protein